MNSKNYVKEKFRDFILKFKHPCIMAKSVFMMENYDLNVYSEMDSDETGLKILLDLDHFIDNYDFNSNTFKSFIAVFPNNSFLSEIDFENKLWKSLNRISDLDGSDWDSTVNSDPESSNFSFSLRGRAFYIVGLHPESSRIARQAPYPAIVFNLHLQFEKLRDMGTFDSIKKRIRARDKKLQGFINPVLRDFGNDTETKQYSGRLVEDNWKCPFQFNGKS
ncbi:MAG: guanitoxin biosynthesis heme-dependent pre-guanitoxin N-hydroxylase GntA [Psychroserpens sp.]|uniref:guanitoxin biosynthesis heme-dependent pre-guanitoxin N-hydroxylase GntA n=1 Tax=Psychroserpens sp. TaxID=2020870 RepID=UPI003C76B581